MLKNTIYCIYGAGGCGRSLMPILKEQLSDNSKILFIDDNFKSKTCNDIEVKSFKNLLKLNKKFAIYIAISSIKLRRKIVNKNKSLFKETPNLISNKALMLDHIKIGKGNLISPFCTIGSNTRIGSFNHINLYSYIEHDCKVGNFVTISPGVKCNGNVILEDDVFIGSGSIIGNGTPENPINIGKGSIIGAGSVVLKSIPPFSKIVSLPPKKLPNSNKH